MEPKNIVKLVYGFLIAKGLTLRYGQKFDCKFLKKYYTGVLEKAAIDVVEEDMNIINQLIFNTIDSVVSCLENKHFSEADFNSLFKNQKTKTPNQTQIKINNSPNKGHPNNNYQETVRKICELSADLTIETLLGKETEKTLRTKYDSVCKQILDNIYALSETDELQRIKADSIDFEIKKLGTPESLKENNHLSYWNYRYSKYNADPIGTLCHMVSSGIVYRIQHVAEEKASNRLHICSELDDVEDFELMPDDYYLLTTALTRSVSKVIDTLAKELKYIFDENDLKLSVNGIDEFGNLINRDSDPQSNEQDSSEIPILDIDFDFLIPVLNIIFIKKAMKDNHVERNEQIKIEINPGMSREQLDVEYKNYKRLLAIFTDLVVEKGNKL